MKALISAAGRGARMGNMTKDTNKCALKVDGVPIIKRLVDSLEKLSINKVSVVVGYQQEKIRDILGNKVIYLENNERAKVYLPFVHGEAEEKY